MPMKRRTRNLIIVTAVTGGLVFAAMKTIPMLIDKAALRASIEKGLHDSTGVRFKIRELTLEPTLWHGIQVNLNTTNLLTEKNEPLGNIDNITIEIRYLPILVEQLPEIAKIHLNHVYIPISDRNLFKTLKIRKIKQERTGFLKPAELRDTEVLLTNYLIEDFKLDPTAKRLITDAGQFRLQGSDLAIHHLESNQAVTLIGNGNVNFTGGPGVSQAGEEKAAKLSMGNFNLQAELPHEAFKEGHTMSASDLGKLLLNLKGRDLNLDVQYQHENDDKASGSLRTPSLDLARAQAVLLQLSDTFGVASPSLLAQYTMTGKAVIQNEFRMNLKRTDQPFERLRGYANLQDLYLWKGQNEPLIRQINGRLNFQDRIVQTPGISLLLDQIPLQGSGWYNLQTGALFAKLHGHDMQVDTLKQTLMSFGVSPTELNGRSVSGLMDVDIQAAGTVEKPSYQGKVTVRNAAFSDKSLGISVAQTTGYVHFKGAGIQNPHVQYNGVVSVGRGSLERPQENASVQSIHGKVAFDGTYVANVRPVTMPQLNGLIYVDNGKVQVPTTDLIVDRIRGAIHLGRQGYTLQNFRASVGGQELAASGQLGTDLKTYRVRVTGHNINLPRFRQDVLSKVPQVAGISQQIQVSSGTANVDLTVASGNQLQGHLTLSSLALETGQPDYPLKIPQLALNFHNQNIQLAPTKVYYGAVALNLQGNFTTNGQYNVRFDSHDVPVSLLRDQQELIAMLSGASLPEIWNTAGTIDLNGSAANAGNQVAVAFHDAGLSWQGGDFPLYGLNGNLNLLQNKGKAPQVSSDGLQFNYGNSPVQLGINNSDQLAFLAQGTLSALTVNHFLVSPQSNATPYRRVPFQVTAQGKMGNLLDPAQSRNTDLSITAYLDLNRTLKHAFHEKPVESKTPEPALPAEPEATLPTQQTASSQGAGRGGRNGRRNSHGPSTVQMLINTAGIVANVFNKGVNALKHTAKVGLDVASTATNQVESVGRALIPDITLNRNSGRPAGQQNVASAPTFTGPVQLQAISNDDNAYLHASLRWQGDAIQLEQASLHLFDAGNIRATGSLAHPLTPGQQAYQAHVYTEPAVELNRLSHSSKDSDLFRNAKGTLGLDLQLAGSATDGSKWLGGWVDTHEIAIPYLTIQDLTGRVDLNGQGAIANVESFKIPGVSAGGMAQTENIFESPVTLENVVIRGKQLSIASLGDFNNDIVKPVIVDQMVHNYSRPWQLGDPLLPIQFRDGDLQVDEVIFQNILLNNLKSRFSVYANSFFELTDTTLDAAGGTVNGYLSMNPNDNSFTTLELNAENIKANALTKALLNVTNQIFGDLSGTVRFTTFGQTDDEMQKNANGTVSMKVKNGRLPAIAKVETLLATANVFRGGVLGLNLNNLLRSLTFYDTNYFAELSGDMLINNQVLYTRNLISDGTDLDLLIRGSLRMDNGNANMLVNGQMSQDVTGKLGFLGKLSLGSLLHLIPGIGSFGKNQTGLLGYVPGIGYVPGFGGPAGEQNHFQVRLVGPLDQPGSIQDFHWVRPRNL